MSPRRRTALVALAALAVALLLAAPALAAAGGGSSGFGGGGGGGGRGAGLYILIQILIRLAVLGHGLGALVIIAVVLAWLLITNVAPRARSAWTANQQSGRAARRRVSARERRVTAAAAEAAEDDPAFAADAVKPAAAALFAEVQSAWSRGDRAALGALVAPDLLAEWRRRLDDFDRRGWHNHVELVGVPAVQYVGLNRGSGGQARVVVRIEATLRDYVLDGFGRRIKRAGRLTDTVRVREFWTLSRHGGRWVLLSIEQGAEGAHALSEQVVATPWSDEEALRDEALVEQATADAAPQDIDIAELADLDFAGDARAAALDLSLADGRFAPDVLAVAVRRALAAWTDAIDGDDTALERLATPAAVAQLLHPGDPSRATRLVLRGPAVEQIHIAALDAAATPPAMTAEIALTARRYVEDRATAAVVAGNPARSTHFTERWRFELTDSATEPWRIAAVQAPLAPR